MEDIKKFFLKDLGKTKENNEWFLVSQDLINKFADATLDPQDIHINKKFAEKTQFKGTIAHGFLILSLLTYLLQDVLEFPIDPNLLINKGFDKISFKNYVRSNEEIKLKMKLKKSKIIKTMVFLKFDFEIIRKTDEAVCALGVWNIAVEFPENISKI